jgi:penicillin G amidase
MSPAAAKRLRLLASALSVLLLLGVVAIVWFFWRLQASVPKLEGTEAVSGLSSEVIVDRDALGVATVRGQTRLDVARGLGWLHAQERFFQMDLLRRSAAGEIAELFGRRTLTRDRRVRRHGFRQLAEQVASTLEPGDRAVLESYTAGVNAGLAALRARPFEYLILRATPQPWRLEDSVLVIYAMTLDLQEDTGRYERSMMALRDEFGSGAVSFFNPLVLPVDAALDGTTAPLPPIPGPNVVDLRARQLGINLPRGEGPARRDNQPGPAALDRLSHSRTAALEPSHPPFRTRDPEAVPGSNAFAIAGTHTASGVALLANDMHLDLGVPNIWFRASLEWSDGSPGAAAASHRVTGVTLPGTPLVVAGSNGKIAWGFTNSYTDTSDLVVVENMPGLDTWYFAPGHPDGVKVEQRTDVIRVKGGADVAVEYPWTIWGPIVGEDERGRPLALRWTAHDPDATNFRLIGLETAANVSEAIAVAHTAGIPTQNFLVADAAGDIGWTIAGRLPKRAGYDGRLPVSWAFGDRRWDGFVPPGEMPVVTTRAGASAAATTALDGRIWSANQRHVGGKALGVLGDGDYARPYRAAQIRDGLAALERATPRDLLAVQLDDRALFLAPWHALLMEALTPVATEKKKGRAALRRFAEPWEGRASIDAVSYRIVREFRIAVYARLFGPLFASCREAFPQFSWSGFQLEPAVWALLREKPLHLLAPEFETWDDLLVAAADDVVGHFDRAGVTLPHANWGWSNTAQIRHPFGNLVPAWISTWLNMPAAPLPGGDDMPRVQTPVHGASERLVVAPGLEEEGIFHMPGGQSAHPLSPFYRAGHEAWVRGEPTPFLPGQTEYTLTLTPQPSG